MGDIEKQETILLQKLKPVDKISIHNIKTVMMQLEQLKHEIKLDDDEVTLIAFSCVDHDYFTNMLINQSDYLEWFTTNYAGENTVEADLTLQIQDKWEACSTLAKNIIESYGRIIDDKEVIFTTKWWEKLRFHHFGNHLTEIL
jgi:hypothetical protein